MKRVLIAALFAFAIAVLPRGAWAICTSAVITTSSTQLAAANFAAGGAGRGPLLQFVGGTSCPAYCDMDVTSATAYAGYLIPNSGLVTIPPTEHAAKTNPIVPSGAIYCIVPSNMGCTSQTVSVCSF